MPNSSWIHYEFPIFFANSLRNRHLFRELSLNSLSFREFSLNSLFFREFTLNSLSSSRINFEFFILSRIHFEFTIFFANSLRIHYFLREFTSNLISISRIYYQFTFSYANSHINSIWLYESLLLYFYRYNILSQFELFSFLCNNDVMIT